MRSKMLILSCVFVLLSFCGCRATGVFLLDSPRQDGHDVQRYDFEATVRLPNCSGSLIALDDAHEHDAALILTNGHCLDGPWPPLGQFYSHVATERSFDLLDTHAHVVGTVHAIEVLYATMTKTDVALYRLRETYGEIRSRFGVTALTLSRQRPGRGTSIEVLAGFWRKGYRCVIDDFAFSLKEGAWLFADAIRYAHPGCQVVRGTSGAPVLQKGTRMVIGINSTMNDAGLPCHEDNPCEMDAKGIVTIHQGTGYAMQVYWIYSCINSQRQWDFATAGCQLWH